MSTFLRNAISLQENLNSELDACVKMFNEWESKIQDIKNMKSEYAEKIGGYSSWASLHQAQGELFNILKLIKRKVKKCKGIENKLWKKLFRLIYLQNRYDNLINNFGMKLYYTNQRIINEIKEKRKLFEEEYIQLIDN